MQAQSVSPLEQWLTGGASTVTETPQPQVTPQTNQPTITDSTPKPPTGEESVQKPFDAKEFEENLVKQINDEKEKTQEAPKFFKDYEDAYTKLVEKGLAYKLEDDYVPKTEEEYYDAVKQSDEARLEQRWTSFQKEKAEQMPPSLYRIQQFVEQGVTTAQDLQKFMGAVSNQEAIASLDPKNPQHQEAIIMTSLINQGLSEVDARAEVEDIKERNKLETQAGRYYPALRKSYDDQVAQQLQQQQSKIEDIDRYIKTNTANVQYFLEDKNQDYLPFRVTANGRKQAIFNLAATPANVTDDGEVLYAYEKHLRDLQGGDERDFKKFMKYMTILHDIDEYEKQVAKKGSTDTEVKNFKKIQIPQNSGMNHNQ